MYERHDDPYDHPVGNGPPDDDSDELRPLRWSREIDQLAGALAAAQGEIVAAEADRHNPHLNTRYATLGSVWAACRVPLAKNGIAVVQGPMFAAGSVTVATRLVHKSGQWVECSLTVRSGEQKGLSSIQVIGSAISYLKRYQLAAMAGVATAEGDDDGESLRGVDLRAGRGGGAPAAATRDIWTDVINAFERHGEVKVEERTPYGVAAAFESLLAAAGDVDQIKALASHIGAFENAAKNSPRGDTRAREAVDLMRKAHVARARAAGGGGLSGRVAAAREQMKSANDTAAPAAAATDGQRRCSAKGCSTVIADDRPVDLCDVHA